VRRGLARCVVVTKPRSRAVAAAGRDRRHRLHWRSPRDRRRSRRRAGTSTASRSREAATPSAPVPFDGPWSPDTTRTVAEWQELSVSVCPRGTATRPIPRSVGAGGTDRIGDGAIELGERSSRRPARSVRAPHRRWHAGSRGCGWTTDATTEHLAAGACDACRRPLRLTSRGATHGVQFEGADSQCRRTLACRCTGILSSSSPPARRGHTARVRRRRSSTIP